MIQHVGALANVHVYDQIYFQEMSLESQLQTGSSVHSKSDGVSIVEIVLQS